jgi:hypothetical protein
VKDLVFCTLIVFHSDLLVSPPLVANRITMTIIPITKRMAIPSGIFFNGIQIANNSRCKERLPMFSELKLPKTALVSYPGSGSAWVRHIVQQLTGT